MAVQAAGEAIKVYGLKELRRALDQAADRTPKEIGEANFKAAEVVAKEAKRRAPRGPHQGGGNVIPIVDSIKAIGTARRGYVAFGGRLSPHAPVYEFGGTIPRRGARSTHRQSIKEAQRSRTRFGAFGIRTTRIAKRAYVYPAIDVMQGEVLRTYGAAVQAILRDRNF